MNVETQFMAQAEVENRQQGSMQPRYHTCSLAELPGVAQIELNVFSGRYLEEVGLSHDSRILECQ
jgi:hypothetical protein